MSIPMRDPAPRHATEPQPSGRASLRRAGRAHAVSPGGSRARLATMSLAALGIVYGDIGTSPLYAFRECFKPEHGVPAERPAVLGVLSLIIWALILIVAIKYVAVIMKLDNRGEGGILALLALLLGTRGGTAIVGLGLFGAALLYGDGVITPAISVLSALEGVEVAAPAFSHVVMPLTLVVLTGLFVVQRHGTARVGRVFGPIMLAWFVTIGLLGAAQVTRHPGVLAALAPWHGIGFLTAHGRVALPVLGAVVLAVTGAEALYADMGHFGRAPIRVAWFGLVFPALLLNYLGQGALVLRMPETIHNPFYRLAPDMLLYPLVGLATMATIIASQALISGTFSLTQQAIQLRYSPLMSIVHTSREERGQIYVPAVNWALMVGCLALVLAFRTSTGLAAAYGVAVTGTMGITTILFYCVARDRWRWSVPRAGAVAAAFLVIDLAFFGANLLKVRSGGWVPLAIATIVFVASTTWNRGGRLATEIVAQSAMPLGRFFDEIETKRLPRVPGTAVFLTRTETGAPPLLLHHVRHNKALDEEVVLLSIMTEDVPEVPDDERIDVEKLSHGFHRVRARIGFMQQPDVNAIVKHCCQQGVSAGDDTSYYVGRIRYRPTGHGRMMRWRKRLFAFMARNASSTSDFFGLPRDHVVELGAQIEL
jgi:KUP system potassium uptake protein